ncbi:MAG: hypothetical protein R3C01_15635 [Planctomycetaceae bacterium]
MTTKTALTTVLTWAVVFACVGSVMGAMIGVVAPDYYRSVFRGGESSDFNPLQVGVGLGVTQGAASGIAISIVVLAILAWRDIRSRSPAIESNTPTTDSLSRTWSVHVLWGVAAAMSVLIISAATFIVGGVVGQQQLFQAWTERKLEGLATILQSDDFDGVEADYSSAAQVYLIGTVKDNAVRDKLREQLVAAFGSEEADEMIWRVDITR